MKKVIVGVILIFQGNYIVAQILAPGEYFIDNSLDKFIGTWSGNVGTDTIEIKLKKVKHLYPYGDYADVLFGTHKYIRNGQVAENYMQFFDSIQYTKKQSISLVGQVDGLDSTFVRGGIKDSTKHKNVQVTLKYVPGIPPTAIWHSEPFEGILILPKLEGQTFPADLILIKQ